MTFFGVREAGGTILPPEDVTETGDGIPVYISQVGSAFRIVAEFRKGRGRGNIDEAGTMGQELTGTRRAGLQVIVSNDIGIGAGRGSPVVCDVPDPNVEGEMIGGVPATAAYDGSQTTTDHINDMACRFDVHDGPGEACTINQHGNFEFVSSRTQKQFCTAPAVGIELTFPVGDTLVTGQAADEGGVVGNQMKLIIRRPSQ